MRDRMHHLLSDFDRAEPPAGLWEDARRRAALSRKWRPQRRLRERTTSVAVAVLVGAAAVGGLAVGSRMHDNRVGPPGHRPSKVGASTWLDVLTSDVRSRLAVTRQLILRNQCFTPQWSFLVAPVYSDMASYNRISSRPDPRLDLGRRYANINNQCNTFVRRGPVTSEQRAALLANLDSVEARVRKLTGVPLPARNPGLSVWDTLLLSDLKTRIPVAARMLANNQCVSEVEQIAYPVQTDINLLLLYRAPRTHTLREGEDRDALLPLGPEFMKITGPCYQGVVQNGALPPAERSVLTSRLAALRRNVDSALR